ncbi:MAG: sulfite reductase subunit alpha [Azoarcus sp.]|nr:sulfite reductase subunit alpha [Azoarcus sp.]
MPILAELPRLLAATAVVGGYAGLCLAILLRARHAASLQVPGSGGGGGVVLIAYASQTGFAEQLARDSAQALRSAGVAAELCELGRLDATRLSAVERALFIVSTCGEGDPPDNGALFARRVITSTAALQGLHYGLLALGDSSYTRFCGFGRMLDDWLIGNGARPMFDRIEVDQASDAALCQWQHALGHLAGTADLPDWRAPGFDSWWIRTRTCLNPGSAGAPTFHLELEPADGAPLPLWEAGDLVQVLAPGDPQRPREYSIASIPADGRLHLLVRQQRDASGRLGIASGWLTDAAALDEPIALRLRPHRNFRLGDNHTRPLILIGNGTGLAGLRAHLRARARTGDGRNWLIFGERNAAHDCYYRNELEDWLARDLIVRADFAFSRDQAERLYVQHRLIKAAATVREWVTGGAAIYVCGNAVGMATEVDAALGQILGDEFRDRLLAEGRYRRDVY